MSNQHVSVHVVRAFTDGPKGGNPAGVVLAGDEFSLDEKQTIARQVGLSETAFVCRAREAEVKLEFFTPTKQIDHCGHATVAAFSLLRLRRLVTGDISTNETVDGVREIQFRGEQTFLAQGAPVFTELSAAISERILKSLGLSKRHLIGPVCIGNTGNNFILIPVRDDSMVKGATPWFDQIEVLSKELSAVGYYLFSPRTVMPERDAGARMFAPYYGIREEAATGMAAGPAGAYLNQILGKNKEVFRIEQGRLMTPPSPSVLSVVLEKGEDGKTSRVWVGGQTMLERDIEIPL